MREIERFASPDGDDRIALVDRRDGAVWMVTRLPDVEAPVIIADLPRWCRLPRHRPRSRLPQQP